jgi:hypothetical protein
MAEVFPVPETFTVPLAPCGEVLAGEDCGCGRTAEEVAAEVAAYELSLITQRILTSPEATR